MSNSAIRYVVEVAAEVRRVVLGFARFCRDVVDEIGKS